MFLKPFRVKKKNILKGSDRKKLKNEIGKLYKIQDDTLADLFPNKGEMSVAKVELHNGDNAMVYSSQKNPIFFQIHQKMYPTVYALWKCPDMIPVLTTWPQVFTKLVMGADLMLPGVVVNGPVHMGTFQGIRKGDIASIKFVGNRAPIVVGEVLLSGEDMYLSNMKGKGVHPIHMMGDLLWESGDQTEAPNIPDEADANPKDVESEAEEEDLPSVQNLKVTADDDEDESVCGATANVSETEEIESSEDEEDNIDPKVVMDELLCSCCLCALKGKVTKSDLPLSTGLFFKNYLQPYCPPGQYIDIKKSTYKKLSKFLQMIESRGLIKVKQTSKGMDSIVEVDKNHLDLKHLVVPELMVTSEVSEDEFQPPVISDVFCIPASLLPFFKSKSYRKGQGLCADEVRQALTDYVVNNNLEDKVNKSLIQLDPMLAEIVLKKSENDVLTMRWDLAKARLFEKMQPAFQIAYPGKPPIIKKGKVDPIKIDVVQRSGNKKVTLIDNVETFGIDPENFAHLIQVKKACSTTVNPSIQKNRGMQIMAQGNQVDFIHDLLLEKYKLPLKFVEGLEKGTKKKKKKR